MAIFGSPDLAIDLGTATTRLAGGHQGICDRPSAGQSRRALACGVIVDPEAAIEVLRPMLRQRRPTTLKRPRVLACAPTDVTAAERRAVETCIMEAGASSVLIVPEPLAAAVGAGIDIGCRYAKFLVDFGDGVTDCAVIRDGQMIASLAARVGCGNLRRTVQNFVFTATRTSISDDEADRILRKVGVTGQHDEHGFGVNGSSEVRFRVPVEELQAELWPVIDRMLEPIKALLKNLPSAVGAEVIEDGIFLTGGGALLPGMREIVATESDIETRIVRDPLSAVIKGACKMLPFAATLKLWEE
ncbi:MAG: rod shape-determining protein [Chthoniobacteraceae bacterium]